MHHDERTANLCEPSGGTKDAEVYALLRHHCK